MTNREAAIKVVRRLRREGHEALLAGGCVRDMLLRRRASDHDIATSARPGEVAGLFRRTLKVGAKFGVVIVMVERQRVEVATFRTESGYADGRHPDAVEFAGAAQDTGRRDFTINGMFYDPVRREVIDYVGGQADLKRRIVRTIGRPEDRFAEDHLRMLRAVRFSAQLGFEMERGTFRAVCRGAEKIKKISGERIAMELEGILVCPNRAVGASMLLKSGLAGEIFDGFEGKEAKFGLEVLGQLREKVDFALATAGLFAGCETESAIESLRVLRLSRRQTKHIKYLLINRGRLLKEQMSLAELKQFLAEPYFRDLYELQKAIEKAKGDFVGPLMRLRRRIRDLGDVELRPEPLLDGHELIRLGAMPGPALGQLAEEMYIAQLEGELRTQNQARQWVQKWLDKHRAAEQ